MDHEFAVNTVIRDTVLLDEIAQGNDVGNSFVAKPRGKGANLVPPSKKRDHRSVLGEGARTKDVRADTKTKNDPSLTFG